MKANRKFVESEEAVSAVIGVILMVAITVAIAATVWYYVSTILPGTTTTAPTIAGALDVTDGNITISLTGEAIESSDARISITNATSGVETKAKPVAGTAYTWTGAEDDQYRWVDQSGDGKIGGGDMIEVYDADGGLASGDWYVKIVVISSGLTGYDSSKITIA